MNIGLIGKGIVGNAIYEGLKNYHNITVYDKYKNIGKLSDLVMCSVIFLAVPTPTSEYNTIDLTQLYSILEQLSSMKFRGIIVIKSTVVPGTCIKLANEFKLRIVHNPEFLTEKNSVWDFRNTDRVILGGNKKFLKLIEEIYKVAEFKCPIIKTNLTTAELIKYVSNSFLATKIIFFNEIYNLCLKLNCDYKIIKDAIQLDKRIGKTHMNVPGSDGKLGFGGMCLPKDVTALCSFCRAKNINIELLDNVLLLNKKLRENKK